jgi:hypothetical protein
MKRKGLGKNLGKGYKNIIPNYDSYIHSLSAKGVKSYLVYHKPTFCKQWDRSNVYISEKWAEKFANKKKREGKDVKIEELNARGKKWEDRIMNLAEFEIGKIYDRDEVYACSDYFDDKKGIARLEDGLELTFKKVGKNKIKILTVNEK